MLRRTVARLGAFEPAVGTLPHTIDCTRLRPAIRRTNSVREAANFDLGSATSERERPQLPFAPDAQSLGDLACESRSDAVLSIAEAIVPRPSTVSSDSVRGPANLTYRTRNGSLRASVWTHIGRNYSKYERTFSSASTLACPTTVCAPVSSLYGTVRYRTDGIRR